MFYRRAQPRWDVRGSVRKISTQASVQSRRRGKTPRPLTPITTVSSPLNLGMNLSPRRISASLRGRNRHITLMLHSAGSAISGSGRREHGDGAWGHGWAAPPRRPRTDRCPLLGRLPQLLSRSSQACAGCPAAPPGRRAAYQLGRLAADLQPGPAPPAHLPATTRRADKAMLREQSPPGSDLPGSGALSHPASAPPRSGTSRPAPLPRLGTVTSLQRSASLWV